MTSFFDFETYPFMNDMVPITDTDDEEETYDGE